MVAVRGYFEKTRGNGVLRISAQVEFTVSLLLHNSDAQDLGGSISTPPSDRVGGSAQGAPSNGMLIRIPGVSNLGLGPIAMHAGEQFELDVTAVRQGFTLHAFATVVHGEADEAVAQVAMWE